MIAGYSKASHGGRQGWLIRTDDQGAETWSRTFAPSSSNDMFNALEVTADGGLVIAGTQKNRPWLLATDSSGIERWSQVYEDFEIEARIHDLFADDGGGYVLLGDDKVTHANLDFLVLRTDLDGNEVWRQTYGGEGNDVGYAVVQDSDGGFVLAGTTQSFGAGDNDGWIVGIDRDGTERWNLALGGISAGWLKAVAPVDGEGHILVGVTYSSGAGGADLWMVRLDTSGPTLPTMDWGLPLDRGDYTGIMAMAPAPDGGFFVSGRIIPEGGEHLQAWILRTDRDGHILWEHTNLGEDSHLACLLALDDGGVAAGGTVPDVAGASDGWFLILDSEGNEVVDRRYERTIGGTDSITTLFRAQDGGFVLAGYAWSNHGWAMRVDSEGTPMWDRLYGQEGWSTFGSGFELENGDLIFAGDEGPDGVGSETQQSWVVQTDADGIMKWSRHYGAPGVDWNTQISRAWHGDFIVSSYLGVDFNYTAQLRRISSEGNERWVRSYGEADPMALASQILTLPDGGFAVSGSRTVDDRVLGTIHRTDRNGVELWTQSFDVDGYAYRMAPGDDGGFCLGMIAGAAWDEGYVLKTTPEERGMVVRVLDPQDAYAPTTPLEFTIRLDNPGQEAAGITRATFWARSGSLVDYQMKLYDGPTFEITPGEPFDYPFSLMIPSSAPLGCYEAGITIYDGESELFSDGFIFEMVSP